MFLCRELRMLRKRNRKLHNLFAWPTFNFCLEPKAKQNKKAKTGQRKEKRTTRNGALRRKLNITHIF